MTKLEELYLDYNRIKSLPQVISTLDNLKVISMYHTGIKNIPEDFKGEVKRETKKVDFIFDDA
jgi:Leucine-rich repeat (LRR) protein